MKWIGFCPLGLIPVLTLKRHIFCTTGAIFYFIPEGRFYAKLFSSWADFDPERVVVK